jgi:thymidylate kinase
MSSFKAPFKALLVEGTSGVGKSTLIDALIRRHVTSTAPRKIRSLVHLAQSHTYGPLATPEDHGTLTVTDNLRHLDRIVAWMEWLHASVQEHVQPRCFVIVDTFHLTHCVRPGVVKWADVASVDARLAAMRCKLLSLRASPETIWKRGIASRTDQQFLLEYATKFGQTHEEIHDYFVREQETLVNLFSQSGMPKLLVQNDGAVESVLDEAYRFWMEESPEDAPRVEGAPQTTAAKTDQTIATKS